ncbi:MAG: tyrosine-type recombinase/integrase [Flavobacteriales bacterium]
MATLKFVLSKSQHQKRNKDPKSMLMLRYTHKKRVTYFTTHKNIDENYWDGKRQCVKRSYPGNDRFNIYIKTIYQKVEDIINGLMIEGIDPTIQLVKEKYQKNKEEKQKMTQYTFFEFAEKFLEDSKKHKTLGTVKTYRTALNKLHQYEKYARVNLDWHNIDLDFYYDFLEYYTEIQGFTNNGFGRVIKILKAILNDATDKGYNVYTHYKHKNFKTLKEDVNNIYLSEDELQRIIELDLSKRKKLDQVRDLFIVGCYTGLRFSDFTQIKSEHIMGDNLRIKTLKTDHWVTIPLLDPVKNIIEKYKNTTERMPKAIGNQTMNKYLKDIGKRAKINDDVLKIRNQGRNRIEQVYKKYELISTHTARRSFATNMFKRGVPSRVIMQITGHKTERAFSTYIKISQEENAALLLKYLNESTKS